MLTYGQQVCQHLGGMELIGESVPYGNLGILSEFLNDGLLEAAVLDPVKHSCQDARRVCNALFFTDLGSAGIKVGSSHTKVMSRHFKGAACTGAGLFKDQGDIFSLAVTVGDALFLFILEICGQIQKISDLFRSIDPASSGNLVL